jgi:hypothetical protein
LEHDVSAMDVHVANAVAIDEHEVNTVANEWQYERNWIGVAVLEATGSISTAIAATNNTPIETTMYQSNATLKLTYTECLWRLMATKTWCKHNTACVKTPQSNIGFTCRNEVDKI